MNYGFNSEVRVGDEVCHVQTEDHGPARRVIETLAYCRGRIIHRQTADYSDFAGAADFSEESLRLRVEAQHRSVMDALKSGAVSIPRDILAAPQSSQDEIQVKLRNGKSWLSGGNAALDIEVVRHGSGQAVGEAHVEVHLEGAKEETRFTSVTSADGLAQFHFRMPPLSSEGAALVIRAAAGRHSDEIRYSLRMKQKAPAPGPKS